MSEKELHNDFESLCAGYVLGALTAAERQEFEQHLKKAAPEELALLEDLENVKNELALATSPAEPASGLEDQIMNLIRKHGQSSDDAMGETTGSLWVYRAVAALLLISVVGLAWVTLDLSNVVDNQQVLITELEGELERQDQLLTVLSARDITLVSMDGLDPSPDGYGKILWDAENGEAVLQLANLPPPSNENDYQLWLIKEGENPISAGVFSFAESTSELFFRVEELNEDPSPISNAFAVTLEPKGGLPQPSGEMYLLGQQQ